MSKVRGSYYVDGQRSMTLTSSGDDKLVDVGFRLVCEEGERHDRGAPWTESSMSARTPSTHRSFARAGFRALGFRLTREHT